MYYIKSADLVALTVEYIDSLPALPYAIYSIEYESFAGNKADLIQKCLQAAIDNGWGNIRLFKDAWKTAAPNELDEVILFSMLRQLVFIPDTAIPPKLVGVKPVLDEMGEPLPNIFKDKECITSNIIIYQRWDSGSTYSWAVGDIMSYTLPDIQECRNPDFGFLEYFLAGGNPYHSVYNNLTGLPEFEIRDIDTIPGNPLYHPMMMREGYNLIGSWQYSSGTAYLEGGLLLSPYNDYPIAEYIPPYTLPVVGKARGGNILIPALVWLLLDLSKEK